MFCAVSFIVLKLKFLDNTIFPEYGYTLSSIINVCKPRMGSFDTITAILDIELYNNKDV